MGGVERGGGASACERRSFRQAEADMGTGWEALRHSVLEVTVCRRTLGGVRGTPPEHAIRALREYPVDDSTLLYSYCCEEA